MRARPDASRIRLRRPGVEMSRRASNRGGTDMRVNRLTLVAVVLCTAAVAASAYAAEPMMGPTHTISQKAFKGYYDGHFVTYLSTDISSKTEARTMHINYSASIGKVKGLPEIYLVKGRAATGQLAVFGSEPGEADYSPLWAETILTWK